MDQQGASINPALHFLIGGASGAIGTVLTSPLELLKTRLQSTTGQRFVTSVQRKGFPLLYTATPSGSVAVQYFSHIYNVEGGVRAFFKGLRPALLGIMPSRAVYFVAYSQYKRLFADRLHFTGDRLNLCAAVLTGLTMSTTTSPIWVIKTRMQLDTRSGKSAPILRYVKLIWSKDGIRGFYRGLPASYAGAAETGLYFVLYERLKQFFADRNNIRLPSSTEYLVASAISKLTAGVICYPHEVVRTRLRQDSPNGHREYKTIVQTLLKVWRDEGLAGVYGGMFLHLLRAVPNTAITFLAYESIVKLVNHW